MGKRSIGFGSDAVMTPADRGKILEKLMPEDLLKFGLIPEFIGRLPVIVTLTALTAEDLVRVLIEPKNAVTRQFQKFLSLDKVELVFTPAALKAAAEVALDRKTGARALRSIVEESLLEVMYDIPERTDVRKCIITEETIRNGRLPLLLTKSDVDKGVDETNYEEWLATRGETAYPPPAGAAGAPAARPLGCSPSGRSPRPHPRLVRVRYMHSRTVRLGLRARGQRGADPLVHRANTESPMARLSGATNEDATRKPW